MRDMVEQLFMRSPLLFLPLVGLVLFVVVFVATSIRAWRGGVRGRANEALLPFDEGENKHV